MLGTKYKKVNHGVFFKTKHKTWRKKFNHFAWFIASQNQFNVKW